jgi:hypothetical protein
MTDPPRSSFFPDITRLTEPDAFVKHPQFAPTAQPDRPVAAALEASAESVPSARSALSSSAPGRDARPEAGLATTLG